MTQPKPEQPKAKKAETYKVLTADGRRVLFEGNEDDSRAYIEQNFPRVHAESGANYGENGPSADVHLVGAGGKEQYNGTEWSDVKE